MQGKLQNKIISVEIATKCKHCDQSLHVRADSKMRVSISEKGSAPLVFMPDVDWNHFSEQTIIDAY